MTEALVFGTFCAAYIFFQFSACIAKDVDKIFNDSFDTIAFKLASLSGEDFEKYFSPALEKITNPGSLYNKKLLVLKNGLLREVENIIAGKQQSNDPIFSVFFNEAKKLDSDKSIKINWFVILKEFSLEDLSNDKILLYTLKAVIKNAKENERSRYAPLHIMTEDQQAFFIGLLKEEKCVVNFSIQYLSNLLEKASAKQGKLLIENFLIKISWIRFSTSKEMVGLVAWMRNHGDQLAPENKEKIDDVILERLERDIQKITSDGKKWDDIRLAWKSVRELSLKTPAENVYRAVVALREKDPVDVMQITKILGGFMFANPKAPFTVVLKEKYGDLFILMYFTLPAEENKQRNTIVTGAVASYESLVEKEQALRAMALENTQKREEIEK
ncbi:MAG: hypothetical protein NTU49_04425, partial [Gammaproteobacteria bacterium]|nr:hypothetical protein [Gammaproteobacteria bacterium]